MIRIFIGYDENETVAYHVLAHSIIANATQPVTISPLRKESFRSFYVRERSNIESTDFSFTRFLVPYLCDYEGWAMFMDCDMVNTADIAELWAMRDDTFSVMCVKHDYQPTDEVKFLGNVQTRYEKKNWSSVMLFNNERCAALTPQFVSTASGLELHQFKWLTDETQIGALPARWNHLVGYDRTEGDVGFVHYTLGGPYFDDYGNCEYAAEWFAERDEMLHASQRAVVAAPIVSA